MLKGRKREDQAGELGNAAHCKQGLTCWRGGRGRSGFINLETQHITNEDSPTGGEEEEGVGWWAWKHGTSQTRTHSLEGRKMEERVRELGNITHHKRQVTNWRGRRRSGFCELGT